MKQCTNCPGRTDHTTADCPLRPTYCRGTGLEVPKCPCLRCAPR